MFGTLAVPIKNTPDVIRLNISSYFSKTMSLFIVDVYPLIAPFFLWVCVCFSFHFDYFLCLIVFFINATFVWRLCVCNNLKKRQTKEKEITHTTHTEKRFKKKQKKPAETPYITKYPEHQGCCIAHSRESKVSLLVWSHESANVPPDPYLPLS